MNTTSSLKRCVIIVNPASTNYARGQRLALQLQSAFTDKPFEIVETRPLHYVQPQTLMTQLQTTLDEHTLIGIAGGDGTVNLVVNALLTSPKLPQKAHSSVLLPLWGGNANDLAFMSNGSAPAEMTRIIETAGVVPVHPLSVTISRQSRMVTKLAVCYVSFGASAYASARMSDPNHRSKHVYRLPGARLVSELASVTKAFVGAPTFLGELDGQNKRIYDLMMLNGPRIARINKAPVKLTDDRFYEILINRKHPLILSYLTTILRGMSDERLTRHERIVRVHADTWLQIDGEPRQLTEHTTVTIKPYETALNILSTKLKADDHE